MAKAAATKKPPARRRRKPEDVDTLVAELERYDALFSEVTMFLDFMRGQREELKEAEARTAECKNAYEAAKREESAIRDSLLGAKDSLVRILEPGVAEFFPLFDRMEPADEEKHGVRSDQWRKEPVAALRLSPRATELLLAADVILVGQLQDRIQSSPESWWQAIEGLTLPTAAAIADRLADFIREETSK